MGAKKYSPSDKAAILMTALGEDLAPELFSRVGKDDATKIARALKNLGAVEHAEVELVLREFLVLLQSPKVRNIDPATFLNALKTKNNPKADLFLEAIGRGDYQMRVFDRTRPEILHAVVQKESPQTLALIFSHAPSQFAAELLRRFRESERLEILLRMASLKEVDPILVEELDSHLIAATEKLGVTQSQKIGGVKRVAEILNALNQDSQPLLEGLSKVSPELTKSIQDEMFTFEDLLKIDDKGAADLVKIVKRETLLLALRGAPGELIQKFARGMSERSAKMFHEDLEALGAQKKSEVLNARSEILKITRELIDQGKIACGSTSGAYI